MLSDTANDITTLPGVTATAPVQLDGDWRGAGLPNNGTPYGAPGVDATHPPIARAAALVTAPITTGDVAGTNKVLTVAVPAAFKVPDTLVVTKGANNYTLTGCAATKTATTFTCTAVAPAPGANVAVPATVSAQIATLDGNFTVTTPLAATWNNGTFVLTVTSTMAFAPESFWVNGNLVSCGGYTAATFTNCSLPANITAPATLTNSFASSAGTGTIGGFIKIERAASTARGPARIITASRAPTRPAPTATRAVS